MKPYLKPDIGSIVRVLDVMDLKHTVFENRIGEEFKVAGFVTPWWNNKPPIVVIIDGEPHRLYSTEYEVVGFNDADYETVQESCQL